MWKNVVSGFLLAEFVLTPLAFAQGASATPQPTLYDDSQTASSTTPVRDAIRDTLQNRLDIRSSTRTEVREDVQLRNADVRGIVSSTRSQLLDAVQAGDPQALKDALAERQQMLQDRQQEFRDEVTAQRETMRARLQSERDQFQARLQNITDGRRRQLVERIADRIQDLLARRVEQFTQALNKLDEILNRIQSRRDKALAAGLDVSAVDAAIADASAKIDTARAAVADLADNSYPIGVTTDEALKDDVEATRRLFATDLQHVFDAVKAARDAVHQAAVDLGQVPGVNDLKDPSAAAALPEPATSSAASSSEGE